MDMDMTCNDGQAGKRVAAIDCFVLEAWLLAPGFGQLCAANDVLPAIKSQAWDS